MEIILKENVANVGFKDELVTVKAGFGRNFLIPSGKAILATESAKKVLAENLKQKAFKEKSIIDETNNSVNFLEIVPFLDTVSSVNLFQFSHKYGELHEIFFNRLMLGRGLGHISERDLVTYRKGAEIHKG